MYKRQAPVDPSPALRLALVGLTAVLLGLGWFYFNRGLAEADPARAGELSQSTWPEGYLKAQAQHLDVDRASEYLAALAEVMRLLIAGGEGRAPAPLAVQRRFFESRIAPWAFGCCDAIIICSLANYYRRASEFAKVFLAIERDSIAMD